MAKINYCQIASMDTYILTPCDPAFHTILAKTNMPEDVQAKITGIAVVEFFGSIWDAWFTQNQDPHNLWGVWGDDEEYGFDITEWE